MGAQERFLVPETMSQKFMTNPVECYRGMPWTYFSDKVQRFVYGHNVAIMTLNVGEFHVIRQAEVAESYRKQFEFMWAHARVFEIIEKQGFFDHTKKAIND